LTRVRRGLLVSTVLISLLPVAVGRAEASIGRSCSRVGQTISITVKKKTVTLTCTAKGGKKVWVATTTAPASKTKDKTVGAKIFAAGAEKFVDMASAVQSQDAQCMLVMKNGAVIGEWNFALHKSETNVESASVTKSFAATLMGVALRKGLFSLDDPATKFIPEWIGTPSAGITIRHILAMTTGRREWTPANILNPQLNEVLNVGQLALGQDNLGVTRYTLPGKKWAYRSGDSQVLAYILTRATGETIQSFARRELFEPLGMTIDVTATSTGLAGLFAGFRLGCEDLAKLVQLYLNRGQLAGKRILEESFVVDALSSQTTCGTCAKTGFESSLMNGAYGLHWWLNAAAPNACAGVGGCSLATTSGPTFADLPTNMFYASGLCHQLGAGLPTEQLVVVVLRKGCDDPIQVFLSSDPTPGRTFFKELARAINY